MSPPGDSEKQLSRARDGGGQRGFVRSLDRGLAVIRAFGPDQPSLSLSEVARSAGLSRAAARRFLLTLVELGYARSDGRAFALRPRVLELGYAYLSGLSLTDVAQPHVEELVARVHESSSISLLDGDDVVYVVRVPTKRIMSVSIAVGTRFPAYATSMGRVILAGLPEQELEGYLGRVSLAALTSNTLTDPDYFRATLQKVREDGFAAVDQELEVGLRAIAAPIHDASRTVTAAINVSVHAARVTMEELIRDYLPHLRHTARQIEADLQLRRGVGSGPG